MKRISTLSILIIMLATSCQTNSKLGSSSLVQKRRYTKGFNLNIKKPVISEEENAHNGNHEITLVEAEKVIQPDKLESASFQLKTDESNKRKLASEKLSQSLLNESLKSRDREKEISSSPPTPAGEVYPLSINDGTSSFNTRATPSAAGGGAEVTVLIIILTILLPPLGVALVFGLSGEFWLSLLLTILFYFPGLIYSLIVIL